MATRAGLQSIPRATPAPEAGNVEAIRRRVVKRRRLNDEPAPRSSDLSTRQVWADQNAIATAKTQCQLLSGNNVISCYPTANTVIAQDEWTSFVWNSRRPELLQNNLVDVYLFRADSGSQVLYFPKLENPPNQAGVVQAQVNDTWFGNDALKWNGKNITYPFYWVLIDSGQSLDGSQLPQSVFTAVQTTYADVVVASISSASAASASSVAASLSSESAVSVSRTRNSTPSNSSGSLQTSGSGSSFPHWAIAVIVVLGFLALLTACIVIFLLIRRRRRGEQAQRRDSMNSASPMIQHHQGGPSSPLLAGTAIGRAGSLHDEKARGGARDVPSVVGHDGASTISRSGSANEGPFSGADAAIMADAFRKMLRKPDFAGGPVEEGEHPENEGKSEMINRELAEEGRDIRSVRSERGYKVETLSDDGGDTIQDHHQDR